MNIKSFLWIGMFFCCCSCELGERLEIKDMGEEPGYFLECYCQPGEMFEMTATRLAPIAVPQILDYSLEFDVRVVAEDTIKLNHSLFVRPNSNFLYNYASARRLDGELNDTVYLHAVTPDGELLTAKTAIPQPVSIDTVFWEGNYLTTRFTTSEQAGQNYFLLTVMWSGEQTYHRRMHFLGNQSKREQITSQTEITRLESIDSIVVELKRLTAEGYKYQYSLHEAQLAGEESLFSPVQLTGNISGAMGIFTCYRAVRRRVR